MQPPRRLSPWWYVFGAALLVRLLYWWWVTPDWLPSADADQYVQLARALAAGDGFALQFPQLEVHPTAFRPPLLPVVLAPGAWLFGDALWPARLVMAVTGSAVVVVGGQYAARIGGRTAGWVTAGLLAVYPPILANDTVALSEPLGLLLVLWALLALDEERWTWCAIATGLLLLARPNGHLLVVILAAFLWVRVGPRRAVAFVGLVALVVAPWIVRNQVAVGVPRLVTSDGFTLAAIYSPQAQRVGGFVDPVYDPSFDDARFRWAQFDEAAWSGELTEVALVGLRDRPTYVVRTMGSNLLGYFELDPDRNRWAEDNDGRDWGFRSASLPLYWIVTVSGLFGIALHWRDRRIWPLLAMVAQFVMVSLALVAPPRLRAPFDVLCCIGVGLLVAALVARRRALDGPAVGASSETLASA